MLTEPSKVLELLSRLEDWVDKLPEPLEASENKRLQEQFEKIVLGYKSTFERLISQLPLEQLKAVERSHIGPSKGGKPALDINQISDSSNAVSLNSQYSLAQLIPPEALGVLDPNGSLQSLFEAENRPSSRLRAANEDIEDILAKVQEWEEDDLSQTLSELVEDFAEPVRSKIEEVGEMTNELLLDGYAEEISAKVDEIVTHIEEVFNLAEDTFTTVHGALDNIQSTVGEVSDTLETAKPIFEAYEAMS